MNGSILGVGYEGASLEVFVEDLKSKGVDLLVDVRLNAVSRKKGFSKTALKEALLAAEIRYLHLKDLGNPKDNRAGFWAPSTQEALEAHHRYDTEILDSEAGSEALDLITVVSRTKTVALMCFERDEACCHRALILKRTATATVEPASVRVDDALAA